MKVQFTLPDDIPQAKPNSELYYDDRVVGHLVKQEGRIAEYEIHDKEMIEMLQAGNTIDIGTYHHWMNNEL